MADKPQIYVLDPYHPDALALLSSTTSLTAIPPSSPDRHNWHANASGLLVRSETTITAADFARASPTLRVIVKQGVGVNNIDLDAAKAHGVIVCNTPALNSEAVAELTLALMLDVARRVSEVDRRVRRGEVVVRSKVLGMSLYGKTLGVVGMGNIGRVVARKWRGAMEGHVVACDPYAPEDAWEGFEHQRVQSIEQLLSQADVVSLHVPLTDSTRGMIGPNQFNTMRQDSILINAARGGIVDEKALLVALQEKKLWGAALDAMDVEPPTTEAYAEMLENENVILTPHVGASTRENQIRSGVAVVETLIKVLQGEEVPNRVV